MKARDLMASRFADYQMTASEAFAIIVLQGGLYVLNYWFRWVSTGVMMNLSIIGLALLFQLLFRFRDRLPAWAPAR